jgi:hypothetical protein
VAGTQRSRLIDPARHRAYRGSRSEKRGDNAMNTWSETRSLIVLMAVIAVFYILGRALAGML